MDWRRARVLRVDWNEFGDIESLNAQINGVLQEDRPFLRDWNI